jgi:putative SOS response-associated peptidase YedK
VDARWATPEFAPAAGALPPRYASDSRAVLMCGKYTAMAAWESVTSLSEADEIEARDEVGPEITFRVMGTIPLIVWDPVRSKRRVIRARWGFPHPQDWRKPQPIHARAETIERLGAFADAFCCGGRGIVLVKSFNEAPESGEQHVIAPSAQASGIAFLVRQFDVGAAVPLIAAVMVTVPANKLLERLPTDRMPAMLSPDDWNKWLGEEPATVDELKACLKTTEGVDWTMARETVRRRKATVAEPTGWF